MAHRRLPVNSSQKGISSHQLGRDLGVTQRTAWFMLHRLKHALKRKSFDAPLAGIVEADETYVGGKAHNKHKSKRVAGTQGRSTKVNPPVFGMVQRGGRTVAMTVTAHTNTLEGFWILFKRGVIGIYHWASVKRLGNYVAEFK